MPHPQQGSQARCCDCNCACHPLIGDLTINVTEGKNLDPEAVAETIAYRLQITNHDR